MSRPAAELASVVTDSEFGWPSVRANWNPGHWCAGQQSAGTLLGSTLGSDVPVLRDQYHRVPPDPQQFHATVPG